MTWVMPRFSVGTDVTRLRANIYANLDADANLHGILNAETQFQRHLGVDGVYLVALEVFHITVVLVGKVTVRVRV